MKTPTNRESLTDVPPVDHLVEETDAAVRALELAADMDALHEWQHKYLAPSGIVTGWKRSIGKVSADQRRAFGAKVNESAAKLEAAYGVHAERIKLVDLKRRLAEEAIDVTLPPRSRRTGAYHPSTLMLREIYAVFAELGFRVFESPHVELDELNFQLLNIPPHHPARDMQDTFYVSEEVLLRTHTSPGQIRAMRALCPGPVRVILPGMCYRNEDITPRSEIQFHQVEGLLVGPTVRMSDLKGILLAYARRIFGDEQEIRLRGSYFPFTEPSVEVDIRCTICQGIGCRVCKQSGWLELLGAGLVHPRVLRNGGYDPASVRGIAWGMGVERQVLLRHSINDIRYFFQNDIRLLSQFA
jgi:phenylalanyl-tRNA synthetase alpha chain